MKKMIGILIVSILLVFLVGCASEDGDVLVVGMELQYPPFETTDEEGNPIGISVDLANALGDYLGQEVVIENTAWSGLIPALQSGKIDVIISSMSIRPDRAESVAFSNPYAHSTLAILANKDSNISDINDLDVEGNKVAVKVGTTGFLYAKEHFDKAELIVVDKADTGILEVAQGKSDAFLYDQMSIYNANLLYPDTTDALLEPFQEEVEYWAMAVHKNNTEILYVVNSFIEEYNQQGGFESLGDRYLHDMKATFEEQGIEFFFQPDLEMVNTGK